MRNYSQKNLRWRFQKLGRCRDTIGKSGCFITALCNLADTKIKNPKGNMVQCHPGILDWVATVNNLYARGCLVVSKRFAKVLGLEYKGKGSHPPKYDCIAVTNHFQYVGVPQHFFVYLTNGRIIDSLDGKEKENPYHIISYRYFKNVNLKCTPEEIKRYEAKVKKYKEKLKKYTNKLNNCLNK